MTPEVLLGRSDGDHVRIRVLGRMHDATDYWDGNWLVTPIDARLTGFSATVGAGLRAEELQAFRDELRRMHETLSGEAGLTSMEEWLELRLSVESGGRIAVTGELSDQVGSRSANSLRFELDDLDQSDLPAILDGLDEVLAAYPVLGTP